MSKLTRIILVLCFLAVIQAKVLPALDPNVIPVDDYFRVAKNEVGVDALLDAAAQGSVDGLVKNAKNADVGKLND
jgi:hypothetical protein